MHFNTGYKTFMKEGDKLAYVNKDSNHPPSITRNLPKGINRLLSDTYSSQELFEASAQALTRVKKSKFESRKRNLKF